MELYDYFFAFVLALSILGCSVTLMVRYGLIPSPLQAEGSDEAARSKQNDRITLPQLEAQNSEFTPTSKRIQGTVKWFNDQKGFGFIELAEGKDVFFHYSAIQSMGYNSLSEGDRVEFVVEDGPEAQSATDVQKL